MASKIKGVSQNGDYLRLNFTWNNKRYRPTTTFKPSQEKQAAKSLAAILLDLENNRFHIDGYRHQIKRISQLVELDTEYLAAKVDSAIETLLNEQLVILQNKFTSGIIQIGTLRASQYVINTHLLPRLGNYKLTELTTKVIEDFINTLGFTKKRLNMILIPLRDIFKRLVRQQFIDNNPLDNINGDSICTNHTIQLCG